MTVHWFFCESIPAPPASLTLDAREAAHAQVRRLHEAEEVRLFDGAGMVATAVVEGVRGGRRGVNVRLTDARRVPPSPVRIHLAAAAPTGDRLSLMLDMATQLGISRFTPLECERGRPVRHEQEAKWRRLMIESCKQCHRAHLPMIGPPAPAAALVTDASRTGSGAIFAHPGGEPLRVILDQHRDADLLLLVGPEGGFTDAEAQAMRLAGASSADLGEALLRVETAAIAMVAAAAMLRSARNEPRPESG